MDHLKFAYLIESMKIEDVHLLENMLALYSNIFFESSWEPWNAAGPATSYEPNFSSTPSASQNVNTPLPGGGGDGEIENRLTNTNSGDSEGSMRDNGEETREQWPELKEPKTYKSTTKKLMKKFIEKAQSHIPKIDTQIAASGTDQRFYNNFHAGLYNDDPIPPF